MDKQRDDFNEYRLHIMEQLKAFQACKDAHSKSFFEIQQSLDRIMDKIHTELKGIEEQVSRVEERLTIVEIKSGIYGGIAGVIPFIVWYLTKGIH